MLTPPPPPPPPHVRMTDLASRTVVRGILTLKLLGYFPNSLRYRDLLLIIPKYLLLILAGVVAAGITTGYKLDRQFSLPAETVRHIWLPPRLSVISSFLPRLLSAKMASFRDCSRDYASLRDCQQEAKSREQSRQEAIYQEQHSWQDARNRGQSRRKPNMTDSLCKK